MRKKDDLKKEQILQFVNTYYDSLGVKPTVREIAQGIGMSTSTTHRYLTEMNNQNMLFYSGRHSVKTSRMAMEQTHCSMPVLGYVACGIGEEEEEEILEYIRLPESIIGKGEFYALVAKGNSMLDAGISPGDYVVINKSKNPKIGDIVVALVNNKSNLKTLDFDKSTMRYYLKSCNSDKRNYPDLYPDNLEIQGVAVYVLHKL